MLTFFSRVIRIFLVLTLLGVVVIAAGIAIIPQVGALKEVVNGEADFEISLSTLDTRTHVYDRDANLLHRFSTDGSNRELLTLEDMPQQLIDSIVTIEDAEFYNHQGINLRATFRALVENVGAGGISQGGSTISQQLVKKEVLRDEEPSIPRKIREAVVSWRMEKELTKDQILEAYVNTVYFGSGAYGVQAAAEVYFGKSATELDWPETALLAALISSPADYDPFINPDSARRQREIVLNRLVTVGKITQEQARFYNRVPLPSDRNSLVSLPPEDYYVAEVRRRFLAGDLPAFESPEFVEAIGDSYTDRFDALFRGGLRIHTAYDTAAQNEAERARDEVVPPNEQGFSMAIAAIEPPTGAVRALVGGPKFQDKKFNLATQGDRQPGSSFKTFVLLAALEADYVPDDTISGIGPCSFPNPGGEDPTYDVSNFANSGGSVDTLVNQVTRSSNCAFVRLGQVVGIPNVIETSRRMGLDLDPVRDNNLSLPLGATEVRPLEVASAYAAIANGGVRHEPYYIDRIEDAQGNIIYERTPAGSRVLANDVACLAAQVLEQNVVRGTGTRAQIPDQPAAGKTGTTEEFSDAWFVGFTPQLATAVWMGHPVGRIEMTNVGGINVTGGSYPAQAWGQFMTAYHDDLPTEEFPECEETRRGRYIREDGELSTNNPCAAYPGLLPTDTNGDGVVEQCIANPGQLGYVRCGAIETDNGVLDRYCHPSYTTGGTGTTGGRYVPRCNPGAVPIDNDGDGLADTCGSAGLVQQRQPQTNSLCQPGYTPVDTNGDGRADMCRYQAPAPRPDTTASGPCPAGYPYGLDTDGDGSIDTCYSSPP